MMRVLLAAAAMALSSVASAQVFVTNQQWVPGTIRVPDLAATLNYFEVERDTGRDSARLSEALALLGGSAAALQDELQVLGTSPEEQEVAYFNNGQESGLMLGVLTGLESGRDYRVTFSWLVGSPPLLPADYSEFPFTPIRELGDPSGQRVVTAEFTAPMRRTPYQFFLLDRPTDLPAGFGLAQVNLAVLPEPASWAMMIVGFGLVGGRARRCRASASRSRASRPI